MTKQKRSTIAHFINTTPDETADTWELLGAGINSLVMNYNANVVSETRFIKTRQILPLKAMHPPSRWNNMFTQEMMPTITSTACARLDRQRLKMRKRKLSRCANTKPPIRQAQTIPLLNGHAA